MNDREPAKGGGLAATEPDGLIGRDGPALVGRLRARALPDEILPPGAIVDRFIVHRILGMGGAGVVYAAHDPELDRTIALKILRRELAQRPDARARFLREAQALARLSHPNVISVYDVGAADGCTFIAMEYIPGQTFADWVATSGASWQEIVAVLSKAGRGLAAAHAADLIHRDFKPSNLLVGMDGRVVVTDFGLARAAVEAGADAGPSVSQAAHLPRSSAFAESITRTGAAQGTPAYMAPEQREGQPADARADQFSFCVTLYEALFRVHPFLPPLYPSPSLPSPAVVERVESAPLPEPPDPRRVVRQDVPGLAGVARMPSDVRGVPVWLQRTVQRGLSWRPEDRYPSMDSLLIALTPEAVRRRRRVQLAHLTLIAAFAILAVGAVILHRTSREAHERLMQLYVEQGRQAVLIGDSMRGLVYLSEAYRAGAQGPAFDLLLGTTTRDLGEEILTLHDPGRPVGIPEFSPDGRLILTSGNDGISQVWDARMGRLLTTLRGTGPRGWIKQSAFSPDSKRIAVRRAGTTTVDVWDAATGHHLYSLPDHTAEVTAIVHSPDGRRILTTSLDASARIWSADTGALFLALAASAPIRDGNWSPDGHRVAAGGTDGTLTIWDTNTGRRLIFARKHQQQVRSVWFSRDGTRIATTSWDSTARIWDAETGALLSTLSLGYLSESAIFFPDGSRIVTAGDRSPRIWDVRTGTVLHVLQGHAGTTSVSQVSPDGKRVLTSAEDGTARLWDATTGDLDWTYVGTAGIASFDASAEHVAIPSVDGTVRVWDARKTLYRTVLRGHKDRVGSARFSPDGTRILTASADRTIKLWNAATGRQLASTDAEPSAQLFVAWSPDGTRFLTIDDRVAKIWDVQTMRPVLQLAGHTAPLWAGGRAGFSPDGSKVVTASQDRTARIWDAKNGRELLRLEGHRADVYSAEFSPDGNRIVTASEDSTARIWDASTGALLVELDGGHTDCLVSATFDRSGTRVLTTSCDTTAKIWNASSGALLISLEGHTQQVNRSDFNPDGALVVTSSIDGTAKIWDSHDGRLLGNIYQPWIGEVTFSPDGMRILTASRNGTAKIWDLPAQRSTPDEIVRFRHCRVPFAVEGNHLVAAPTDPRLCATDRRP